jgi:ribosomal protein S12 methylthiotransferase
MKRPAASEKTLDRIQSWRAVCPDITLRSTFIVGFPGETEHEFNELLDFIREAKLDRVGCFKYSAVDGATANALENPVPEEIKEERWHRFMALQQEISAERLKQKVGQSIDVMIDEIGPDGAVGRSKGDAPEIDGAVYVSDAANLKPGDIVSRQVVDADDYDLWTA